MNERELQRPSYLWTTKPSMVKLLFHLFALNLMAASRISNIIVTEHYYVLVENIGLLN